MFAPCVPDSCKVLVLLVSEYSRPVKVKVEPVWISTLTEKCSEIVFGDFCTLLDSEAEANRNLGKPEVSPRLLLVVRLPGVVTDGLDARSWICPTPLCSKSMFLT